VTNYNKRLDFHDDSDYDVDPGFLEGFLTVVG